MLRQVLIAIGVLLLIGAGVAAACGVYAIVPHLLVGALVFGAGVAWERWRYGALRTQRPEPHWQATGERFIDPETQALVEVWYDPRRGERHYLRLPPRE
ncbi:hypothetical protein [Solimonas soli]|uniref:hypothetical protein n=1 Tax=Solimonas soli TaxID=413479 RepID=UPI0004B9FDAF|nr:hypothetical protein [Solimonas soli]